MLQHVFGGFRPVQQVFYRGIQADASALRTGPGTYVHQPVGAEHGFGIVLHHHDGVPFVAQFLERGNQFAVVALVQADAGLVQDVKDVHQFGTDLGGQADALALAARKGGRGAVQRQVVQAHVQHEAHPVVEFFEDVAGDAALPVIQFFREAFQPRFQLGHLPRGHLGDGFSIDPETIGMLAQPGSAAHRADHFFVDIFHDAVEGDHLGQIPFAHAEKVVRTENDVRNGFVGDGGDGIVQGEVVFAGNRPDDVEFAGLAHLPQRDDAAFGDGEAAVGDEGVQVYIDNHPESLAVGAVAFGRVEREGMRLRFRQGNAADRIDKMLGVVRQFAGFQVHYGHGSFAGVQRGHDRVAHPFAIVRRGLEFIYQ